jgi:hypothetical protein
MTAYQTYLTAYAHARAGFAMPLFEKDPTTRQLAAAALAYHHAKSGEPPKPWAQIHRGIEDMLDAPPKPPKSGMLPPVPAAPRRSPGATTMMGDWPAVDGAK